MSGLPNSKDNGYVRIDTPFYVLCKKTHTTTTLVAAKAKKRVNVRAQS